MMKCHRSGIAAGSVLGLAAKMKITPKARPWEFLSLSNLFHFLFFLNVTSLSFIGKLYSFGILCALL